MAFNVAKSKEEGLAQIKELVESFKKDYKTFKDSKYNETQLRNDFVDALLMSFGWDVDNNARKNQFLRDVIQEESIDVEDEKSKKNPDYTLRVQGLRKLFVEAKKPHVDITKSAKGAFQTRRYGWNANLGISILTNFEHLIIYDCRHKPSTKEDERVARIQVFEFTDYLKVFDELYDLISFETASTGRLDDLFSVYERVGETFDDYFLAQIESWRERLATSAVQLNEQLGSEDINFLIQRLLNRIVFLRICEDRTIEKYETLKGIQNYGELKALFQQSDKKYNSGLFDFIEDNLSLNIEIDADVLIGIFNELYYPLSPYDFSVVDPTILSQIYEKFLGSHVVIDEGRQLSIVSEPEVVASNGVVPTPKIIVEKIVKETLAPLVEGKNSTQLADLKIADICCGSGTFLITVYDFLLKSTIEQFIEEGIADQELIYELPNNAFGLTLKAKRNVIEQSIYGVDINPYATEVTEFSLLLKLLEGESGASIDHFIGQYATKVLPTLLDNIKCGNSLVDEKFYEFMPEAMEDDYLLFRVKPFEWNTEFPFLNETNGFDAIIGNPPYVRIQNLVKFSPEEVKYYQDDVSGFGVAKKDTIDKYYVFIQQAIALLNPTGFLGYIVPNKFFIIKGGRALRKFISESCSLSKIIHFGVTQVFPDRSTYTAILILQKEDRETFQFKRIKKITPDILGMGDGYLEYAKNDFTTDPWVFLTPETKAVFDKLSSDQTQPLKSLADICVGLQTSKDPVYIFIPEDETENTFIFNSNGEKKEVEKGVCLPCIYDLSFGLFDSISPNAQMIFPYVIEEGKAETISEEHFNENYPLCWAYLNEHKEQLEKRSINGKDPKWYQFGRSQSLTRFHDSSKLIWHVLSTKPSYILDVQNVQFTGGGNGPYYSLVNDSEYDILYFMGILSHPLFESMVKAGASEFRGAYYSHGKQFIENIPVRIIDQANPDEVRLYKAIVKSVKDLIKTKGQYNEAYGARRVIFQRKLDMLSNTLIESINTLYGISAEEFKTVLHDEIFANELMTEEE
ncbi:Eco57I restriction-modification methylase domain-containing protein [Allomuricauda sp. NBRC 101325]|uniref:Eco57I restriction-modification methylase domain-containing protein n=1 Tax=Allomuricauda sp. NBRC 101325 TaxID=1113758 RepID=UPI00249FE91C|nr:N-6 DNA methylase [Muricauda sp. NBRC 101325]GLU43280.1 adenine methyltransferase [Muricauda sp. NBRC 101325]